MAVAAVANGVKERQEIVKRLWIEIRVVRFLETIIKVHKKLKKHKPMSEKEMDFTDERNLRRKAEEKLKKNEKKGYIPEEEHDKERLLHELQVHQIELEMQNEELQQAYERAEEALQKYTILYDFAPTGFFTLDAEGTIQELNFTSAELLGDKRISLIGSNFKLFLHQDSIAGFNKFFSKVFTTNIKESCQLWLGHDDKPLKLVYIEGVVIDDDNKCLLSVIDITNFQKRNNTE